MKNVRFRERHEFAHARVETFALMPFSQLAEALQREDGEPLSRQGAVKAHDALMLKLKRLFLADPLIREYLVEQNLMEPDDATDDLRHRDDRNQELEDL